MPVDHVVKVGEDWLDGFLIGKAARMADWRIRKEIDDPEFEALCRGLSRRNAPRRWKKRNRDKTREDDRKRRRATREATALTLRCEECPATWRPVAGRRSSRFCSRVCRNRWHGRHRTDRNRGMRQMNIKTTVFGILLSDPWLNKSEILDRAPHIKPASLATSLCSWVRGGQLMRRGARRQVRYSVAQGPGVENLAP